MRAVLDTNILARPAHNPEGPAAEVLDRLRQAPHVLLVSHWILSELNRALRYERVRRLHGLSDAEIDEYVASIEAIAVLVDVPDRPVDRVVPADPDDDYIVATAVLGHADVLCTRNKHFRDGGVMGYCRQRGVRVMDELELLRLLRQGDEGGNPPQP